LSTRSRVIERIRPATLAAAEQPVRAAPVESPLAATIAPLGAYISSAILIGTGYHIWQEVEANLHVVALYSSLACYVFGFILAFYGSLTSASNARKENLAIGGLVFAFLAYAVNYALFRITSYGTDAMLFNAYSAELVLHGANPYAATMQPAFSLFNVPKNLVTPTATGDAIFSQSYPALSFLIYVPFALLGINAIWVSILSHVALILILVWVAPRPLKAVAPLILFADPSYAEYTLGSVTDIIWAVPIALCAYFWRSKPQLAALFLGIACCRKQSPWFVVPFAVVYWAMNAWSHRSPRRFYEPLAIMLVAFFLFNAPYIVVGPHEWVHGVLTPMAGNLIAFGSGIVQLLTANVYATDLRTLTIVSASVLGLCVIAYAIDRRRLAFLPFIAPGIALFFAARSLQNYFMFWPVALVAFHFSAPEDVRSILPLEQRSRISAALVAVGSLAVVLLGFMIVRNATVPATSLRVSTIRYAYNPATNGVNVFEVRVENSDHRRPHEIRFGILQQGQGSRFDYWVQQPQSVGPDESRDLRLKAPSVDDEVRPGNSTVQVVAIDADSGVQVYSDPETIAQPSAGLVNARLASWQAGPPSTPVGWEYSGPDFKNGYVWHNHDGRRNILSFNIAAPRQDEWHVAAVSQQMSGTLHKFSLSLRPYENYVGDAYPRRIFGLEIIDPLGHHAYYTIDSELLHSEVFKHDQFTTFVLPGRLHDWNTIDVDPDQLVKTAGFILSDVTQVQINVVAAVHRGEPGSVRGDFGGIGGE